MRVIRASARKHSTNPWPTALIAARGISVTDMLTLNPWNVATTEMMTPKTKLFMHRGQDVAELDRAQQRAQVFEKRDRLDELRDEE